MIEVCPLARIQCLARENIKAKLFDLLLIEAYSKGERGPTL